MAFLALPHRNPTFGFPQRKPRGGRGRYELNPAAILSRGLQMALIIDGPLGLGGLIDYAVPGRTFSTAAGTPTYSTGAFGGQANCGFATSAGISFSPTIASTPASFSCSALVQFDANGHGAPGFVLLSTGSAGGEYISTQTTTSGLAAGGGGGTTSGTIADVTTLTGWHRIGISCTGSTITARYFFDGVWKDQTTAAGAFSGGAISQFLSDTGEGSFSWGWNVADLFFWNRTLSDAEMAYHAADPYASVLRPRYSERWRGQMTPLPSVQEVRRVPRNEMVPI